MRTDTARWPSRNPRYLKPDGSFDYDLYNRVWHEWALFGLLAMMAVTLVVIHLLAVLMWLGGLASPLLVTAAIDVITFIALQKAASRKVYPFNRRNPFSRTV